MLPGIENMNQAESSDCQQKQEKTLLLSAREQNQAWDQYEEKQSDHTRGGSGFVPRPVRQHIQAGLCGKQQHQPQPGTGKPSF